jgi:hypothetical protein
MKRWIKIRNGASGYTNTKYLAYKIPTSTDISNGTIHEEPILSIYTFDKNDEDAYIWGLFTNQSIDTGEIFTALVNKKYNLCLSVNLNMESYDCLTTCEGNNLDHNKWWKITDLENATVSFIPSSGSKRCLNRSTKNLNNKHMDTIQLTDCNSSRTTQQWIIYDACGSVVSRVEDSCLPYKDPEFDNMFDPQLYSILNGGESFMQLIIGESWGQPIDYHKTSYVYVTDSISQYNGTLWNISEEIFRDNDPTGSFIIRNYHSRKCLMVSDDNQVITGQCNSCSNDSEFWKILSAPGDDVFIYHATTNKYLTRSTTRFGTSQYICELISKGGREDTIKRQTWNFTPTAEYPGHPPI